MNVIYKYCIDVGENKVNIPLGSKFLSVKMQRDVITMWFLVDVDKCDSPIYPNEIREFLVVGTGHPFKSEDLTYLGTVLSTNDTFVWHIFER